MPTKPQKGMSEFQLERRAKKLASEGYRPENIAAMMYTPQNNIRQQHVEKWIKHKVNPKEMDIRGPNY